MSYEWKKGPVCGEDGCPSKRFREDETGVPICQNGHAHPERRSKAEEDEDDFLLSRRGRTTRRKKEKAEKAVKHFEGKRAFELYLVSYQLILRKQLWWLMKERGLPAELETLVHDLWALRLQKLSSRIPTDIISDTDSQQLFSSQSEETSTGPDTDTDTARSTYGTKHTHTSSHPLSTPRLDQSLALLYMALYILKHPITLGDIFTWVSTGKLLYYHAIREIPSDMKDRLPATYHDALDPSSLLAQERLWKTTTRLFLQYQRDFGMQIPRLNYTLHFYRYIVDLGLPLPVYHAAKRIAEIVGWEFKYPDQKRVTTRLRIVDFPEAQLVGAFVVAVKLLYPFDGVERVPHGRGELGAVVLDWEKWSSATEKFDRKVEKTMEGRLGYEDAMRVTEDDVLGMSDEKIDEYLDWYAKSYMNDQPVTERSREADFRRYLLDTFPVERSRKEEIVEDEQVKDKAKMKRLNEVISSMIPRQAISAQEEEEGMAKVLRPGEGYKRYRKVEDLPPIVKQFYAAVAKLVGFDLDMLIRAVFLTEVTLEKWILNEKRKREPKRKYVSKLRGKGKQKVEEDIGDTRTSSE